MEQRKVELSEVEVQAKIVERTTKLARIRLTTIGGIMGGTAGVIFAFVALLRFESATLSVLGFVVMGLGYGLVTPEQVVRMIRREKTDSP